MALYIWRITPLQVKKECTDILAPLKSVTCKQRKLLLVLAK